GFCPGKAKSQSRRRGASDQADQSANAPFKGQKVSQEESSSIVPRIILVHRRTPPKYLKYNFHIDRSIGVFNLCPPFLFKKMVFCLKGGPGIFFSSLFPVKEFLYNDQ